MAKLGRLRPDCFGMTVYVGRIGRTGGKLNGIFGRDQPLPQIANGGLPPFIKEFWWPRWRD
jgi:hypothetical protein